MTTENNGSNQLAERATHKDALILVAYDPAWPAAQLAEREQIKAALGACLLELHAIGSTAVPGLLAKPILDLMGVVESLDELDRLSSPSTGDTPDTGNTRPAAAEGLLALGYEAMGAFGIPGRRFFRKHDARGARSHHLHIFEAGSEQIKRHLIFRDRLRESPTLCAEYSGLKESLAARFPGDRARYTEGKSAFITEVVNHALAESTGQK